MSNTPQVSCLNLSRATFTEISDENGFFDGQKGYGYGSLEKFIDAAQAVTSGKKKASDFEGTGLPTIKAV